MKYLKGYQKFIKDTKISIDKNASIVEKKVLEEFSSDFWNLCMKSAIFNAEEKTYIKESLSIEKVSLIKEEWEWLDKTVDWMVDKGGKLKDFFVDKIKKLRDGIKNFVKSMVDFAKKLFMSFVTSTKKLASTIAEKYKDSTKEKFNKLDQSVAKGEIGKLKETLKWWGIAISGAGETVLDLKSNAMSYIYTKISSTESEAVTSSEANLKEAEEDIENEGKNESISNIISSTSDDIFMSFYNFSPLNESEEVENEENKGVLGWLLQFVGQEEMDPEAKTGKKLLWWGKLFLKVLAICLNPLLKGIELWAKKFAAQSLSLVSSVTHTFGGPGPYKFLLLGGLVAGILGAITDGALLAHIHIPGYEAMAVIKKWVATALENCADFMPGMETIMTFLKAFCCCVAIMNLYEEIKHLSHSGHEGEHKEETEVKPGTPAKPEAQAKPGVPAKPATGTAAPPAA